MDDDKVSIVAEALRVAIIASTMKGDSAEEHKAWLRYLAEAAIAAIRDASDRKAEVHKANASVRTSSPGSDRPSGYSVMGAPVVPEAKDGFESHAFPLQCGGYSEDLSKCPRCGAPADNGHDRCYPPNPYVCSKCSVYGPDEDQRRGHSDMEEVRPQAPNQEQMVAKCGDAAASSANSCEISVMGEGRDSEATCEPSECGRLGQHETLRITSPAKPVCGKISPVDEDRFYCIARDAIQSADGDEDDAAANVVEAIFPYLRTPEPVSLKDYVNMAQTESNLEFRKTCVRPTIYYQAMEAAVKAVLEAAGVPYVE